VIGHAVADYLLNALRQLRSAAVEGGDPMAFPDQLRGQPGADEAGSADDQDAMTQCSAGDTSPSEDHPDAAEELGQRGAEVLRVRHLHAHGSERAPPAGHGSVEVADVSPK